MYNHYEITLCNGHYPLTYQCSTIHEAYGCMETLATGYLNDNRINLDRIMEVLVSMSIDTMTNYAHGRFVIKKHDCEV